MKGKFLLTLLLTILLMVVFVFPVMAQASGPVPVVTFSATPEKIAMVAGLAVSLILSWFPGLRTKFARLSEDAKKGIMLLVLAVTAGAVYGLNCSGFIDAGIGCDQNGVARFAWLFILAMVTNQSTFKITPLPKDVKTIKAEAAARVSAVDPGEWPGYPG